MSEKYLVSVDGHNAPTKQHDTYEAAMDEAQRLSPFQPNRCVRVLKQVAVLVPRAAHEIKEYK